MINDTKHFIVGLNFAIVLSLINACCQAFVNLYKKQIFIKLFAYSQICYISLHCLLGQQLERTPTSWHTDQTIAYIVKLTQF